MANKTRITFWIDGVQAVDPISIIGYAPKPYNVGDIIYLRVEEITPALAANWRSIYAQNSIADALIDSNKEMVNRTKGCEFTVSDLDQSITYRPLFNEATHDVIFGYEYYLSANK